MGDHVPLPEPDPEPVPSEYASEEPHDEAYVEDTGYRDEADQPPPDAPSLPLSIRRSLREVLGDDGEDVEKVWLAALESENERIRVEAAKTLTQATVQLSKASQGSPLASIPKTPAEVALLTREESFAALIAIYVREMDNLRSENGNDDAIRVFRERHPEFELPLALLQRALS